MVQVLRGRHVSIPIWGSTGPSRSPGYPAGPVINTVHLHQHRSEIVVQKHDGS